MIHAEVSNTHFYWKLTYRKRYISPKCVAWWTAWSKLTRLTTIQVKKQHYQAQKPSCSFQKARAIIASSTTPRPELGIDQIMCEYGIIFVWLLSFNTLLVKSTHAVSYNNSSFISAAICRAFHGILLSQLNLLWVDFGIIVFHSYG